MTTIWVNEKIIVERFFFDYSYITHQTKRIPKAFKVMDTQSSSQDTRFYKAIASLYNINSNQVSAACELLDDGATVPFIARYRKEKTGGLDEVQITSVRDQLTQLRELEKRRQVITQSLQERDLLTEKLHHQLSKANALSTLEDIYLPFKLKKRTRASIAKEKGLEPMAKALFSNSAPLPNPKQFIHPEKGVDTTEQVMAGSRDIVAEWISEDARAREKLRYLFEKEAAVSSKIVEKNRALGAKFKDYFDRSEPISKIAGHRFLAMLRGESEKILRLSVRPPEEKALTLLHRLFNNKNTESQKHLMQAIEDSFKRLLAPSLENEIRNLLKQRADKEAIQIFADNLTELLLASPLGQRSVMALDPGFRTGAKLVCLDNNGNLLHTETIYPTQSEQQRDKAGQSVRKLIKQYAIESIGIGNGTAGRETEQFIHTLDLPSDIIITMVDESGASIYSASTVAREEFPDHDITVRGAVSIGRRLQDPLAELVKLDPKSIGVGQYQHDVNQKALQAGLDDTVISCVNKVGVNLNTASESLLSYVSGLNSTLARNIVIKRAELQGFSSRKQVLKVPRLGAKTFELCAGFLRIQDGDNPLDNSAVHPESYSIIQQMAKDQRCSVKELLAETSLRKNISLPDYITDTFGLPTLQDIMKELDKPGRDPRTVFAPFSFADNVHSLSDLETSMILPGIVTNVTKFGAFVDIGVHQDGLVHISQLADKFVKDPAEVVKVRQQVQVRVLEIDIPRKRISLSMRDL